MSDARDAFLERAQAGGIVPVTREVVTDADTPVAAFAKIARPPFAFLLESVVGGEKWARYTFLGTEPRSAWRLHPGGRISRWSPGNGWGESYHSDDPLSELDALLRSERLAEVPGLPRFVGGAVG